MDELLNDVNAARRGADSASRIVTVRYWAGAREAAGCDSEQLTAATVAELREVAVSAHPALAEILPRCSFLVDGRRSDDAALLDGAELVEVLPPFAGG